MSRAKGNPADAAVSVRVVEPIHFPDLSERRALKLSAVHRYVARGLLPSDWGGDMGESTDNFGE